jgi:hypothetical protein
MTVPGNTYSTLLLEAWEAELESTLFFNDFMFNNSIFTKTESPSGSTISTGYEYSVSTTTGTFDYDDPMNDPFTLSHVRAYHNKDWYQEAARIFGQYVDMTRPGAQVSLDQAKHEIEIGTKNLIDIATTTMWSDVETNATGTSTYSDASLTCSTYDMTPYAETTSTALTLAHMEDAEEALLTHTTYGNKVRGREDLVWCLPANQLTNLSRLGSGVAYNASFFQMSASSQDPSAIDAGRQFRTASFNGVPLVVVPDMTTTTLLLLHKPDCVLYQHRPFTIKEKSELADTMLWHLTIGCNAVVKNPKNQASLTSKTA